MAKRKRQSYYLAFDIGGTKVLAALVTMNFRVAAEKKIKVEPEKGRRIFLKTIEEAAVELLEDAGVSLKRIKAVGAGCPGIIRNPGGRILLSPNLPFLNGFELGRELKKKFGVPVAVENDVNTGLYGEQRFGAAQGKQHVLGIFMGTGVGGALILNGKIYHGALGAAGEIGHTYLIPPFMGISAVRPGTLEGLTGRMAISADSGLLLMQQKAPHLYEETGYDVRRIKSKSILRALKAGDKALGELIGEKARYLGLAMANAVNLLNPEMIVLGGGLVEALGASFVALSRQAMETFALPPLVRGVRVVGAKLGDYAIVLGAAGLAESEGKAKS